MDAVDRIHVLFLKSNELKYRSGLDEAQGNGKNAGVPRGSASNAPRAGSSG